MTLNEYQELLRNRVVERSPKGDEYSVRYLFNSLRAKVKKSKDIRDYDLLNFEKFKKWFYNEQTSYKITKIKRKDRETSMSLILYDNKIEFIPNSLRSCLDGFKYIKVPFTDEDSECTYIGIISNFTSQPTGSTSLIEVDRVGSVELAQLVVAKLQLIVTNKIIDTAYENRLVSKELRKYLLTEHSNKFLNATKGYTVKDHLLAEEYIETTNLSLDITARVDKGYCDYINKLKNVYYEIEE